MFRLCNRRTTRQVSLLRLLRITIDERNLSHSTVAMWLHLIGLSSSFTTDFSIVHTRYYIGIWDFRLSMTLAKLNEFNYSAACVWLKSFEASRDPAAVGMATAEGEGRDIWRKCERFFCFLAFALLL